MANPPDNPLLHRLEAVRARVLALVAERKALRKALADAEAATAALAMQLAEAQRANTELHHRHQLLRIARALPPEDEARRDLKLKINAYIRQIDQAIASLGGE